MLRSERVAPLARAHAVVARVVLDLGASQRPDYLCLHCPRPNGKVPGKGSPTAGGVEIPRKFAVLAAVSTCLAAWPAAALAGDHVVKRFGPGAPGIGDPYFPLDGNGGYDVKHYDLDVAYEPATDVLRGIARSGRGRRRTSRASTSTSPA